MSIRDTINELLSHMRETSSEPVDFHLSSHNPSEDVSPDSKEATQQTEPSEGDRSPAPSDASEEELSEPPEGPQNALQDDALPDSSDNAQPKEAQPEEPQEPSQAQAQQEQLSEPPEPPPMADGGVEPGDDPQNGPRGPSGLTQSPMEESGDTEGSGQDHNSIGPRGPIETEAPEPPPELPESGDADHFGDFSNMVPTSAGQEPLSESPDAAPVVETGQEDTSEATSGPATTPPPPPPEPPEDVGFQLGQQLDQGPSGFGDPFGGGQQGQDSQSQIDKTMGSHMSPSGQKDPFTILGEQEESMRMDIETMANRFDGVVQERIAVLEEQMLNSFDTMLMNQISAQERRHLS